jgi:AcrR family transcriptional regulator
MEAAARSVVLEPKQERSRASLERILAAATQLLQDRGYDGLTLNDVSRLSGVSIGAIYGRVTDKEGLVRAVQVRVMETLEREQRDIIEDPRWNGLGLKDLIPPLFDDLAEFLRRHAAILRAFMMRAAQDPVIASVGKRSAIALRDGVETLLLQRRGEIRHPDPDRAAAACFNAAYSTLTRYLGLGTELEAAGEGDWAHLKFDTGLMAVCFLKYSSDET